MIRFFSIDKSVLAPVQLIRSVPSLLSSDRERYEMASRSNSIGYKN